jgi:ABC-type cobalamin/Fe3+-siderophores transport system ATPase subunit
MMRLRAEGLQVVRRSRAILNDVSLDLGERGLIAIAGPNGAGKSTLVKCLAGVLAPDRGDVYLGDRPLGRWPGKVRAAKIGYLPQHFEPHWDFTSAEILAIGAARAGLAAPDTPALAPLLNSRWSTLSGGERTRVLFAAIESGRPSILIADEPAANLDVARQVEALARLRAHAKAGLAVVVLHDLNLALRSADRLIVLENGRIRLDGSPADVALSPDLDAIFGVGFVRERLPDGLWLLPQGL